MNQKTALIKHTRQTDLISSSWDLLSPETQTAYKSDLDMFFAFVKKNIPDVTAGDVIGYIAHLRSQKYKNSTINRKVASVSKMFKVYMLAGQIKYNPVELARETGKLSFKIIRSQRSPLLLEEIHKCITAKSVNRSVAHAAVMIKFLAKTGLRISEMLNIELRDMENLDSKTVKIRILGKGKKERFITLEKKFIESIKKQFAHESLLFCTVHGEKYNRRYVWRLITERFMRSVGLKVHPHMLRHFYATYKIVTEKKDIKSVSKFLGHAGVSVTLDMYVDTALSTEDSFVDL